MEGQTVERGIRAGGEQYGVLGRHAVQLRAGRIALFAQAGDEHLPHDDPFPFLEGPRAGLDIIEHVLNLFHRRNRMIELRQARIGGVSVRVHQAGQDQFALQVHYLGARAAEFLDFGVAPRHQHAPLPHSDSLVN